MTKGKQRAFVLNFFGIQKPMTRKRRRHWKRQQRRRNEGHWKNLAPITTVAPPNPFRRAMFNNRGITTNS